jgi:hypothetical protein
MAAEDDVREEEEEEKDRVVARAVDVVVFVEILLRTERATTLPACIAGLSCGTRYVRTLSDGGQACVPVSRTYFVRIERKRSSLPHGQTLPADVVVRSTVLYATAGSGMKRTIWGLDGRTDGTTLNSKSAAKCEPIGIKMKQRRGRFSANTEPPQRRRRSAR